METFSQRLNALRTRFNLTNAKLADIAKVPESLISGLQSGTRNIGENNARKIGAALGLTEGDLEEFVYLAINNSVERVLHEFKGYPAEVLNLVAMELREAGIGPQAVTKCIRNPSLGSGSNPDAALYLKDGRSVIIDIQLKAA